MTRLTTLLLLLLPLLLLSFLLLVTPHAHAQSVGAWATSTFTSSLPPRTRPTLALSSTAVVLSGVIYPAGSVVFYGGQNRNSYNSTLGASNDNDVWISSDAGDTWRHVAGRYRDLSASTSADAWITAPTPFADTSFIFYDGAASCSDPTLGVYYRIGGRVRNATAPTPQWITTNAVYMSSTNALSWSSRPAASLPPRAFANCVVLTNGTVLVYNGFMTYAPGTNDGTATVADAWASYDSGATFVMINRNATYRARGDAMATLQKPPHPSVDPQPLIWLFGGRAATGNLAWLNDVYVSSNYGATWTLRTSIASWYATSGGAALVSDGGLLTLFGGLNQYQKFQDVWVSADGGLADWSVFSVTTPNVIGPGAAIILPQSMGRVLWVGGENYTHDLNGIVRFNYGIDVDPALLLSAGSSTTPEAACVGYQRCTRSPQMRINNNAESDSMRGFSTLRFRLPVALTYISSYTPTGNLSAPSGSMIIISGGLRRRTMSAYWTGDEGLTMTPIDTESMWVEEPTPCVAGSGPGSVLVLTGGTNEDNVHVNLVQASYDFGATWSTVSGNIVSSAGNSSFTPRRGHACFGVGSGMSLVVFGGFQGDFEETNEQTSNDVWTSDDGGRTWQQRSAAPWLPRAQMAAVQLRRDVASTQVRPADLMYVIGGQRKWLNTTRSVVTFLNDVWASTDGLAWVQMSAAAPFRAREGGAVAVHSTGALVYAYGKGSAVGGSISTTLWMRDMWFSTDGGASWVLIEDTQALRSQAISMYAVSFFASSGRLVIMSGTQSNVFLESQTLFTTPSSLAALNADVSTSLSVAADACFAPQYVCTGGGTPPGGSMASSAVRKAVVESFASVVMSVSTAVVAIAWVSALLV